MLSEKVIPPKGEGEIKVTYNSGKRKGSQSKSVSVETNDPNNKKLSLKVKGIVKEAVACKPDRLNFGKIVQGDTQTREVTVTPGEGEKVKVNKVESLSEYVTTKLSKNPEGEGYVVQVTLSPKAPRGRLDGQVKVYTDNENAREITVYVNATITGEIVFVPDRVTLIVQKEQENQGATVTVHKEREGTFAITKVECDVLHVSTELQTLEEGRRYTVLLNASDQVDIGRDSGTLTLHTDAPDDPEVKVPLTLIVRGNLNIIPEQLSFGLVNQGDQRTKTITVSTSKEKLKIKKVKCDLGFLTTNVEEREAGKSFQIKVTTEANAPDGQFDGTLTIETDDSLQPKVEIPVNGRVRAKPST